MSYQLLGYAIDEGRWSHLARYVENGLKEPAVRDVFMQTENKVREKYGIKAEQSLSVVSRHEDGQQGGLSAASSDALPIFKLFDGQPLQAGVSSAPCELPSLTSVQPK